ncbi:glycogen debranching N-terminal domain-containing protein [Terrabacter aerolatus]|uniref:Amylo-alpha-1,6-glucosidase n=1 Tax=Terrabacter aerolatus TaxID=422442 RepID=A0A512D1P7_9MICO|nr:glycogen debranching N-terminal domain-containing protein [Terrabacter aerolatus]GEO30381.1 amylo-alpha-1,6-glucosidase [Terrabacter aerolatus]
MTTHRHEDDGTTEPGAPTSAPHGQQPWLHDLAICVDGNGTALSGSDGSMTGQGAHGYFVDDQRVVSRFTVALGTAHLVQVAHSSRGPRSEFFTSARGLGDPGPDPTVELRRRRVLTGGTLREHVIVASRASQPVAAPLVIRIAGDGADIGPVKAGVATGELLEAHAGHGEPGPDTDRRGDAHWQTDAQSVRVSFSPAPDRLEAGPDGVLATFDLTVDPGTERHLEVVVQTERRLESHFAADAGSDAVDWPGSLSVDASDPRLGKLLDASLDDLRSLLLKDPADPRDVFAAAGTPWYLTLFGRDSLWTARMMLPLGTTLAAGTLRALARRQGVAHDVDTAEAPGKIPHELRRTAYEDVSVDFTLPPVYYGTVDATALWICLLHDAWRWGLPADEVRSLLPHLRAAASWLTDHASPDEDGFIKYVDESGHGLANQGWKDSGDSMRFRDGSLAAAPIALVEAQAYAVEAAVGAAALLRALGEDTADGTSPSADHARAAELESWASLLRERIRDRFWVGPAEQRYLAMAIDSTARPVDGVGSNMGHVLGTGSLTPAEAQQVTDTLVGSTMLGDFGIATLATDNGGFNPIGYHTGSVWVHDTAICALGMAREGHSAQAARVVTKLLDVGEAFDYRLPELFADSATIGQWAPYPASCRPQAWAAASSVAMLTVALGITVDVPARRVRVRPPSSLPFGALAVKGLRVGEATVSVVVDASGEVSVEGLPADYALDLPQGAPRASLVGTVTP